MGYQPAVTAWSSAIILFVILLTVTASERGFSRTSVQGAWCASEDSGPRAYVAGVVFEGKARSRSPPGPGGVYYVTFVVERVYKDTVGGGLRGGMQVLPERFLRARSQVRLPFVSGPPANAPSPARCEDMARLRVPQSGVVRANIKQGGRFFVFADHVGSHNLTVRGPPMRRTRSTAQAVSAVLCPTCVRPPRIWGLRNRSVTSRRQLRLACRTSGSPSPAVVWVKDGLRIAPKIRRSISHTRKRSTLLISRVRPSDAGVYECRAVSVTGETAVSWGHITVHRPSTSSLVPLPPPQPPTGLRTSRPHESGSSHGKGPLDSQPCKTESYCLHGGTCKYFETIGEQVCVCAEGYKGPQCESKDVRIQPTEGFSLSCKLGISSTFYC